MDSLVSSSTPTSSEDTSIEISASQYSSLEGFRDWTKVKSFSPLPGLTVKIWECKPTKVKIPPVQCHLCKEAWDRAGLVEILRQIDWHDMSTVEDRDILALGLAFNADGDYCNGVMKCFLYEFIRLVRFRTLCRRHCGAYRTAQPSKSYSKGGLRVPVDLIDDPTTTSDSVILKGCPDISVYEATKSPYTAVVLGEAKPPSVRICDGELLNSGQILFHLISAQLQNLQNNITRPLLGIYAEGEKIQLITAKVLIERGGGEAQIVLEPNLPVSFIEGVPTISRIIHSFMCSSQ